MKWRNSRRLSEPYTRIFNDVNSRIYYGETMKTGNSLVKAKSVIDRARAP